jgi:tRNA1(Val) A37 N6-methylase TrmN6
LAEHARALQAAFNALTAALTSCSPEELSTALGGVDIFATTLEIDAPALPSTKVLESAAAFVLLSQIIVYEALARRSSRLAPIDTATVRSWSELHDRYFQRLRGTGYDQLFAAPVAMALEEKESLEVLRSVVKEAQNLLPLQPQHDVLGKTYHKLVPVGLRKRIGAFYTNDAAAHLLAGLAISTADARVVDPACGSGTLLLAAYLRLKALHETNGDGEPRDGGLLHQLTGVDVMPFAALLAAVNLLLQGAKDQNDSVRLGVADSTGLRPESIVLDWRGKTRFKLARHDVVLMNPPFTRGHSLKPQDKQRLEADFSAFEARLGGLAGLQGYFLLLAHRLLREGGCLGAVLPASTFGSRSNRGLTPFLLSSFAIDFVILCRQRSAFSEQTNLRELLLLARKQPPSDTHEVTFVVIDKSPEDWSAGDVQRFHAALSTAASASTAGSTRASDLWTRRINQASLHRQPRLFYQHVLQTSASLLGVHQMVRELADETRLQPFPSVFQRLKVPYLLNPRGSFALGFKALNILPDAEACLKANDVWSIVHRRADTIRVRNRVTNDAVNVKLSDTIPCFRRLAGLTTINSSGAIGRTFFPKVTPAAERLLTGTFPQAEAAAHLRTLKTLWEPRVAKTRTHLVMAYKADLGAPGTHLLAAVFEAAAYPAGDAWVFPNLPLDQARILALWMNTTFFVLDLLVNRAEQRGSWMRFDKPSVDQLLLLDPTRLSRTQRRQLLDLYARVQHTPLPSLLSQLGQTHRRMIDEEVLQILGMEEGDAATLTVKSASAALEALSELVTVMRGD